MVSKQKHWRTADASTQELPSSGASPQSPGFPQWDDLPQHMLWHVLRSQGLSLRDLAKLAPNGKMFYEACLELYEAELKWLVGTTMSTFGEELVGAALRFLCRQGLSPRVENRRFERYFCIRSRGDMPADSELFADRKNSVRTPALGLLADGEISDVEWQFEHRRSREPGGDIWWHGVSLLVPGHEHFFSFKPRNIRSNVDFRDPSKLTSFLGLQLLLWQKCEEGGQAGQREALLGKLPRRLLLTRKEVSRMPEEAQRAYSALQMWVWRTWRKNVRI
eukprot:jgi/Botrbrau1/4636/Bobra.33_2s0008.1